MHRWVRLGTCIWLGLVGGWLLLAGAGLLLVSTPSPTLSLHLDWLVGPGLTVGAIGAAHLMACRVVWKQRTWGRWLAAVLAVAGLIIAAVGWYGQWVDASLWIMLALGYGLTLAAALVWYPHPLPGPRPH